MKCKNSISHCSLPVLLSLLSFLVLPGFAADRNRQASLQGFNIPPINLPPGIGIPPILVLSVPATGATGVGVNSTVSFTFNVAMAPKQAIAWSANVTPSKFAYQWSADAKTLTCTYAGGFPANAQIQWTLNPSSMTGGFAGQDGTALFDDIFTGFFTTGSGTGSTNQPPVTPCNQTGNTNTGSFTLSKGLSYTQASASVPALNATNAANFYASLNSPTANPVNAATLKLPDGSSKTLQQLFGSTFSEFGTYNDQTALDSAYPGGSYALGVIRQNGSSANANLSLPANGFPPTPQVMNFPSTQAWDARADFTLQINGLVNPGPGDTISFEITGPNGLVFVTPDPCVPRTLANTATSISVPKGTLAAGQTYDAMLSYRRTAGIDSNSIPGIVLFSGFSKQTSFKIITSGGAQPPPTPPTLGIQQMPDGSFQITLTGQANASYVLEGASDITASNWNFVMTLSSPTGISTYTVPAIAGLQMEWFRAHSTP